jgi:hypothetical protein
MTQFNVAFRKRRDLLVLARQRKHVQRSDFLRLRHINQLSRSDVLLGFAMEIK